MLHSLFGIKEVHILEVNRDVSSRFMIYSSSERSHVLEEVLKLSVSSS